jgi:hypothetical protein
MRVKCVPHGHCARVAMLCAKLALMLVSQAYSQPEHLLGVLSILFNMLMIDRLVCSEAPFVNDNGVMMTVLCARFLGLMRAAGQPPRSGLPEAAIDSASALLALFNMHHGRARLATVRYIPLWLFFACVAASASSYAPFEPLPLHAARVAGFTLLALLLPEERLGPCGYQLFLPVLLAQWVVAWVFAACAVWQLTGQEWACLRRSEPRPPVYMPLATEM